MLNRDLFHGFSLQSVDDKGRVAIPADLRETLDGNSPAKQVLITRHATLPCLVCYDAGWAQELNERLNNAARAAKAEGKPFDETAERRAQRAEKATYDANGRFVIPGFERERVGIAKWAFFAGDSDTFQIWSPEVLMAADIDDDDLKDRCRYYAAAKKVAL
ncbi:division/cell wall cluster transcriptional repressor MraZ [Sphingomonas sp. Y38-1Y]|uniref:division/cell wall cluster transcriptional repressor MraZ n=1 Tax=Sphingomonas sp. Y38-1Y TaxID=3078265 RepID=UPI0028E25344|nr:division/cell wall cluster transcriptional repressor MraZ [Sphingomonas sp. Y38-1Y]